MGRSSLAKRKEMYDRQIKRDLPVVDIGIMEKFSKSYIGQAARLAAAGFSNADMCYVFGVDKHRLVEWRKKHPELDRAIKEGKKYELQRLLAKCYLAAEGYRYNTRKKTVMRDAGGIVKNVKEEEFENFQAPDNTMLVFLICNITRQLGLEDDQAWLSKQKLEIDSRNLTVSVSSEDITNQIARMAGTLLSGDDGNRKEIDAVVTDVDKGDET